MGILQVPQRVQLESQSYFGNDKLGSVGSIQAIHAISSHYASLFTTKSVIFIALESTFGFLGVEGLPVVWFLALEYSSFVDGHRS